MPSRSSAAAMAMLPSVAATLPQVGEQLPNNFGLAQFRSCPSCGGRMLAISKSEIYECKECRVFVTQPV
jgi:hypothetical protein